MSSAVNKSQKHFAPNLPRQRTAPRPDADGSKSAGSDSRKQSTTQRPALRFKRSSISKDGRGSGELGALNSQVSSSGSAIDDTSYEPAPTAGQHENARAHAKQHVPTGNAKQTIEKGSRRSSRPASNSVADAIPLPSGEEDFEGDVSASSLLDGDTLIPSSLPSSAGRSSQAHEPSSHAEQNIVSTEEDDVKPPPGYRFVEPAELEEHKAAERRRKQTFERELLLVMRSLYAEKEKAKILESSSEITDEQADAMAEDAASQATYNQLKQAVGNEAKTVRDEKFGPVVEEEGLKPMLHPTKFTMAALCKDVPFGTRNDAYDDYELARVNRRRDTVRVFRAKMWSRRMYQPKEEEKSELKEAYKKYQEDRQERNGKLRNEQQQKFTEIDDASGESIGESHPQASIEIQANGAISLVGTQFDRHKNNRSQREGSGPKTEVDPTEQVINSYSFSTRERPDRWTKEETAKFYEAVSALGTDFNLIAHLFPLRSRNQIKTKYKYEEKRNPAKLQMYMVSRRKFNVDSYSQVSNVPIQEVVSIEDELEKVRQEHAEQMKLEEASRQQAKAEDQKRQSSSKRSASSATSNNRPHPKRERVE